MAMMACALRTVFFAVLIYVPTSSRADRANHIHQFGLSAGDDAVRAHRTRVRLHGLLNASHAGVQHTETSLQVELQGPAVDSEHTFTAVASLMAFLAPAWIIILGLIYLLMRMVIRYVRGERDEEGVAENEDELLAPMKPWHQTANTSPMASLRFAAICIFGALLMYGCVEWTHFVATGPFARRFVCTDTERDSPSSDLTPLVRDTLRGFCWEGYRWVGINRGEAELLLMGLEKSLVDTTASGQMGDVVELGAALGETTLWTSRLLDLYAKKTGEPRRGHRVYDAFEGAGFPPCDGKKDGITCTRWWMRSDTFRRTMNFFLADRRWLLRFLLRSQSATLPDLIQKGFFADNPPEVYPEKVAFAMFDSDMYISILDSFKQVYPRMSNPGGLSFTHDVDRSCCAGPRVAASQYLAAHGEESKGFYTWEGQRPWVTLGVAGPSLCKGGACKAPPGEGWKWNTADANAAEEK